MIYAQVAQRQSVAFTRRGSGFQNSPCVPLYVPVARRVRVRSAKPFHAGSNPVRDSINDSVSQLVERIILNYLVAGSSPAGVTIIIIVLFMSILNINKI